MPNPLRIALAQINTTVGDLPGNEARIRNAVREARSLGADIVAFPELTIAGYPPEDLLLKHQFVADNKMYIQRIVDISKGMIVIAGFVDAYFDTLYNAAAVLNNGRWAHTYHKTQLPNYGVFDEKRYFQPGGHIPVFSIGDVNIGVSICEDIWLPNSITECQAFCGDAQIIINISASPYHAGKTRERDQLMKTRATHNRAYVCYVNLIGGQDELVFDGNSLIIAPDGAILARGNHFEEDLLVCDLDVSELKHAREHDRIFLNNREAFPLNPKIQRIPLELPPAPVSRTTITNDIPQELEPIAEIYQALKLGVRDYVRKNGFTSVVLGLSGGIDSALTAAIACDALGAEHVVGISMPSQYSSEGSIADARQLAENLGMPFHIIPIRATFNAYKKMLAGIFKGQGDDITEENIQARIRGNIVMAFSNKFGHLALTTGNKSEVSVGYATLYGDMAGGFSIIKDVPKTLVYQLARFVNREREIIPESTLSKPPSAELRPDQKDEDSLPPYDILDPILEMYVEKDYDANRIVAAGYDPEIVRMVINLVERSEYKRRQAPPGVRITPRAFGKDRRMPITNRYRSDV